MSGTDDGGRAVEARLEIAVPADWEATGRSRRSVAAWLRSHDWPADDIDDALLAVNEAVSNSIEHGYRVDRDDIRHPGTVVVTGRIEATGDGRFARFEIRDRGVWRTDRHDTEGIRSRGLVMMRAIMRECEVSTGPEGTVVRLTSDSVPPAEGSPTP